MKKIFLSLTLLLFIINCLAQKPTILNNDEIKQRIENVLTEFHGHNKALKNFCGRGSIFIKLKMNAHNESLDIALTKDSSKVIVSILNNALNNLQKDKSLIYSLKKIHKTIVIPLIYNFEADCDLSLKNTQKEADKIWMQYELNMGYLYTTILDMLNFNDGNLSFIDCILLSPCIVGAVS